MDTRIALMGQPLDFAGSLSNGLQAGMAAQQAQRQNALGQLYQSQGPQIMAGDPQALNALARMDPNAAIGIQQNRQQMQMGQEQLAQIRRQAAQQAQAEAAQMSAEQAAQASAKLTSIWQGALMAQDEATYNATLAQNGINPAQYPFATRDQAAAMIMGAKEVLDIRAAQMDMQPKPVETWRPATPDEAARYGAAGGQIGPGGKFDPINPPSGGIQFDPETGRILSIGGAGKNAKPATEAEAKNAGFLIRMRDSQDTLNRFETQGTDLMANLRAMDPTGISNYVQAPEYQLYEQAKRDFINALLRRESGAVIGKDEFASAERQYFPAPGDSPEVIAQKRKNRDNAVAGVTVGAGTTTGNPLVAGTGETGTDFGAMDLSAMVRVDVMNLNADQLAAFNKRMQELNQ